MRNINDHGFGNAEQDYDRVDDDYDATTPRLSLAEQR